MLMILNLQMHKVYVTSYTCLLYEFWQECLFDAYSITQNEQQSLKNSKIQLRAYRMQVPLPTDSQI